MDQGVPRPRLAKAIVDRITHEAHIIEAVRLSSTDGWQANNDAMIGLGLGLVATPSMAAARVRADPATSAGAAGCDDP
jgi:hypothetical protein